MHNSNAHAIAKISDRDTYTHEGFTFIKPHKSEELEFFGSGLWEFRGRLYCQAWKQVKEMAHTYNIGVLCAPVSDYALT
jgi:hypothetical protein